MGIEDSFEELRVEVLDALSKPKPKDWWDKVGILGPLLTAAAVALVGTMVSCTLKHQEEARIIAAQKETNRLQRVQIVAQLMPYLTSKSEDQKKEAITAIQALGDPELAIRLAEANSSSGTLQGLAAIARTAEQPGDRKAAKEALESLVPTLPSATELQLPKRTASAQSGEIRWWLQAGSTNFGEQEVGKASAPVAIGLSSSGPSDASATVTLKGPFYFMDSNSQRRVVVALGGGLASHFGIVFKPDSPASVTGSMEITSESPINTSLLGNPVNLVGVGKVVQGSKD